MIANRLWIAIALLVLAGCGGSPDATAEREAAAERYLRGIYECDASVADELAADSIVISYPVFQTIFGKPAVRGSDEVKKFSEHFCSRWIDGEITVDDLIYDGYDVVILWSFRAKNGIPGEDGSPPTLEESAWGGITLIRFNDDGKITTEVGEESTPGPSARLEVDDDKDATSPDIP
jgi:hypothetical protein